MFAMSKMFTLMVEDVLAAVPPPRNDCFVIRRTGKTGPDRMAKMRVNVVGTAKAEGNETMDTVLGAWTAQWPGKAAYESRVVKDGCSA